MPLKLPRFERSVPLVDKDGKPTTSFHRWWQEVVKNLEDTFNDLEDTVLEIQDIVADIQTAQAAADAAQEDADAAAREAARINSYPVPNSVLTASDAGSDATITIDAHSRVYPVQGSVDVADVSITGGSVTGLDYETLYYIYYDDETLSNTTPTFLATQVSATALAGAAAGRHFVGSVTTPAAGGGNTSGTGSTAPGGTSNIFGGEEP